MYTTEPFSFSRQVAADGLAESIKKHWIHALIEVDVSKPRNRLREIKQEIGQSLSFTGFLIYCCAKAVDEDKHLHAYRDWHNRLILYDEVDVFTPVERFVQGRNEVHRTIIRAANRKSVRQIHDEIRQAQSEEREETVVVRSSKLYGAMPAFVRRVLYRAITSSPHLLKKNAGTILVTSLGMFGHGVAWGIPIPAHTLTLTVGGIASRPLANDGQIENREHLCLTFSFNHDIIDGAPAARFVQGFKEFVECGNGLYDELAVCP
ncbi:MAG: dehydrogenase [Chloroflexi bacterium]|nr:MAG: dehydrogenase [Chloroflexota bacterium]